MPAISLDAAYAPELVEFWGKKYKDLKEEHDRLKNLYAERDRMRENGESAKIQELIRTLQDEVAASREADQELRRMLRIAREDEGSLRKRLEVADRDRHDLRVRLNKADLERFTLSKQVTQFYSQAAALAAEADRSRRSAIAKMFSPVSFVDASFESRFLQFVNPEMVTAVLPSEVKTNISIYFLPRPPNCLPLRVTACGQPGYWFFPAGVFSEGVEFELVVEGRASEWSYLGRYLSAPFKTMPMHLSEWMSLDEQTKVLHCVRVASQTLPPGQTAPYPAQLEVKRRYEMGEWSVPCYTLQCVGFNTTLYEALCLAAKAVSVDASPSPSLISQPPTSACREIGKRRKSSAGYSTLQKRPRVGDVAVCDAPGVNVDVGAGAGAGSPGELVPLVPVVPPMDSLVPDIVSAS